ncbi:MAG TPA: enoyl-CoA hydratase [Candidatus Elarobacter sp.]|nr:enoyl-CoA hydratase [Candidatus Elarobacter sp.]HEV2737869.1 enoyl-CoA hydratase [Candidatus Elarobacter sp.]
MIRVERREHGIAWVVFDRPEARNALTFALWEQLREIARELDADATVRVVVFTGAEAHTHAFVSGTDIGEFREFTGADDGVEYEARIEAVIAALEAIRVPTIAAIAGACTGGGVSIAAACDLRIGAPSARIGVPIARTLGNCISLRNIARVAEIVGLDAVKALLLTGKLMNAEQARAARFLNEVVDADGALDARAQQLAEQLVALAPLTLRATKEMCRRLRNAAPLPDDEDLIRLCYGSRDFREGRTAFLDKRRPDWSGT